ncbi:MAG: hypothetical protein QG608_269 [Actinomycetota bacterium]|nr:hypothetical protein [Actinomycetota bacterium]
MNAVTGTPPGRDAETAGRLFTVGRELERLADRLRVLGPRHATRATSDPRSAEAWATVHETLTEFARITALAEGLPPRPVPRLAPHALADQLLVLGRDALALEPAGREVDRVGQGLARIRRAL